MGSWLREISTLYAKRSVGRCVYVAFPSLCMSTVEKKKRRKHGSDLPDQPIHDDDHHPSRCAPGSLARALTCQQAASSSSCLQLATRLIGPAEDVVRTFPVLCTALTPLPSTRVLGKLQAYSKPSPAQLMRIGSLSTKNTDLLSILCRRLAPGSTLSSSSSLVYLSFFSPTRATNDKASEVEALQIQLTGDRDRESGVCIISLYPL
jgi:hypothetical protein